MRVPSWVILTIVLALAAALRFWNLGGRALWLDEFSTWHAAGLSLIDSWRSPGELTPPLYHWCAGLLGGGPRPPEWLLRLPAALAGVLAVAAIWSLARLVADSAVAAAAALLTATTPLLVEYSREARPYSMLMLFATLSMTAWLRLTAEPRPRRALWYALVTALSVWSQTVAVLGIAAQASWWLAQRPWRTGSLVPASRWPIIGLAAAGLLAAPVLLRSYVFRATIESGLLWIQPLSWERAWHVLRALAPGGASMAGAAWIVLAGITLTGMPLSAGRRPGAPQGTAADSESLPHQRAPSPSASGSLLVWWLALAWLGLVAFSLAVQPLLVERYALPAAVPLLLIPLVGARRLDRRLPLVMAVAWMALSATQLAPLLAPAAPGFRELVAFLQENSQPPEDAAVLCVWGRRPESIAVEKLGFGYYRLENQPLHELHLNAPAGEPGRAILADPRRLYLIVFEGDPLPLLAAAGRRLEPFTLSDQSGALSQLYFQPYRLIRVAPIRAEE